jgi:3-hydroxyacyl-[acyl-carrier-protein] dehydratase
MIRTSFHIDAAHPALPGHFPDRPIVPGVVLLDRLAATVEREWGMRIAKLPQIKFLRPLRPGEVATLTIDGHAPHGKFVIECGDAIVAKGTFEVGA